MRTHIVTIAFAVGLFCVGCQLEIRDRATPGQPAFPPGVTALPGEYAVHTYLKWTYVTAVGGGGRASGAVDTLATSIGPYQKFKLWWAGPLDPQYYFMQTYSGNFLSAVNGGGQLSNAFRTDATQPLLWEKFRFGTPSGVGWGTIRTAKGYYVTALGGGGKPANAAFHTDALQLSSTVAPTWEWFFVQKCGDIGSDMAYAIYVGPGGFLWNAAGGGGLASNPIVAGLWHEGAYLTFIRQSDGTYALRTPNGVNYLTAINGGGLASGNNLATDRTIVQAWERFRIVDDGNCMYTIQTASGFYIGLGGAGFSTRIGDPNAAPQINYIAKFKLIPYGRW